MMFPDPGPRVLGLPPGVDFPERLVDGLLARAPRPEDLARATVFLNTARMRRRVQEVFAARGALLLPRLRLIAELADDPVLTGMGKPMSALGRRLEVAVLIDRLLQAEPSLAPRSALFDLADSLSTLMDEMRGEGVSPQKISSLDVSGHSAHWARAQRFMALAAEFFEGDTRPDAEARQRQAVQALIAGWRAALPKDPVIIGGSTGSRGTTALLMQAVARLPQGAVVLPGFDFDLPAQVWDRMDDALIYEAHPQFRIGMLLKTLGLQAADVQPWVAANPPSAARNRLVSLSLRPAPVTDQWLGEGAALGDLLRATKDLTLVEAASPRQEAMAVALVLRGAVEAGQRACLVSPDRDLTRRVAAALDRWGIRPDDSAGQPLQQSAPGRLLRMTANAMGKALSTDQVLALLKHPLTHSGERGEHLRLTRNMELHLRRHGPAFPESGFLRTWSAMQPDPGAAEWGIAIGKVLEALAGIQPMPLPQMVQRHRALTEVLARGPLVEAGSGGLWEKEPGAEALQAMDELEAEAPAGFVLSPADYAQMLGRVMARREVRSAVTPDKRVEILGSQEARIQGADVVVLGGLNEGSWPETPAADPWLNRRLRRDAGLLLPERKAGLAAHDYQMAVAAPRVVLTRAHRNAEAETVPSRWVNRLTNLMAGLPANGGEAALKAMRARGAEVLAQVALLEAAVPLPAAARPSPRPPLAARPKRLSITAIETLVSDPYAIYARHVLRLNALNPLRPEADFRLRGEMVHQVLEAFLRHDPLPPDPEDAAALLMQITDRVLQETVPWPVARAEWRGRMQRIALPFASATLRRDSVPVVLEEKAALVLEGLDFTLTGKPDRIDMLPDGTVQVIDYKAGAVPSKADMQTHRKQLHLAAVMALEGAFQGIGPRVASRVAYQSMAPDLKTEEADLTEDAIRQTLDELRQLIAAYQAADKGFTARRAAMKEKRTGDYDHLSRLGEWTIAAPASPEDVG